MKLKISVLLTILFSLSATVFGQKEAAKPKTETKTVETKTPAAKMPTVKEILANYVKAIGGKSANEKVKSRMTKGTIEISPMGIKGTFENYAAAPGKSVTKSTLAGIGDLIEGYDGQTAWSVNPIQGSREKQGEELEQTKLAGNFYREINLDKLFPKMELKGTEKVGEKDTYVVVGTPVAGSPEVFYFDTKSGLLVRQDAVFSTPEGKMPTKTFFEDFRKVDGITTSFKSRTMLPQYELITVITEMKNNIAVEDGKFAKPKS